MASDTVHQGMDESTNMTPQQQQQQHTDESSSGMMMMQMMHMNNMLALYQQQQQQHGGDDSSSCDGDGIDDDDDDDTEEESGDDDDDESSGGGGGGSSGHEELFAAMQANGAVDPQQAAMLHSMMQQWMGAVDVNGAAAAAGISGVHEQAAAAAAATEEQSDTGGLHAFAHPPPLPPPSQHQQQQQFAGQMMSPAAAAAAMQPLMNAAMGPMAQLAAAGMAPHPFVPHPMMMMHPGMMLGAMPPPPFVFHPQHAAIHVQQQQEQQQQLQSMMMASPHLAFQQQLQQQQQQQQFMDTKTSTDTLSETESPSQSPQLHSMESSILQQSAMLSATLQPTVAATTAATGVGGVIIPSAAIATANRQWQLHILKPSEITRPELLKINITMRIRGEEARCFVPDKLYSSHRYVIHNALLHDIVDTEDESEPASPRPSDISKSLWDRFPLLIGRCSVVNSDNHAEEILKNEQPILRGEPEAAIARVVSKQYEDQTALEGTMKIQFTDVSYHHDRKNFALRINYMDPQAVEEPLFYVVSPPFTVYARKPSNTGADTLGAKMVPSEKKKRKKSAKTDRKKSKKRVKSDAQEGTAVTEGRLEENGQEWPSSEELQCILEQSSMYEEFGRRVEQLMSLKERLAVDDRKRAHEITLDKLLDIDADYRENFFAREWE